MLMSAYAYVSYKHILVMNEREILLTLLQHYYNMTHLSTSCTLHIQMHRTYTAHATVPLVTRTNTYPKLITQSKVSV